MGKGKAISQNSLLSIRNHFLSDYFFEDILLKITITASLRSA